MRRLLEELQAQRLAAEKARTGMEQEADCRNKELSGKLRDSEAECSGLRAQLERCTNGQQEWAAQHDQLQALLKAAQRDTEAAKMDRMKANFSSAKLEQELRAEARRAEREWQRRLDELKTENQSLRDKLSEVKDEGHDRLCLCLCVCLGVHGSE